jgi:gentisate 1,2-dioxygenase
MASIEAGETGAQARPIAQRARAAMEALNAEAAGSNLWLRTQANAPAQRPWFSETEPAAGGGAPASGKVAAGRMKALPCLWRWAEISPYLDKVAQIAAGADVPPIEFADRQQLLLLNPGLGGRLQVTSTMRCAVSIYNPGDIAPAHLHSPNATRTILSDAGGYTNVEGERCPAARGDIIVTPNGTWHDHGNDGSAPVKWVDVLDWPLLEFLDCIWLDEGYDGPRLDGLRAQAATQPEARSQRLYGRGGLVPAFPRRSGIGINVSPMVHYRGADIRAALADLRDMEADPYEGAALRLTNPATGGPLFPTFDYRAQLLRPGAATAAKRETASTLYMVMEGEGYSEIGGQRFDWARNDIFVAPNFLWRRHVNSGRGDAILYAVSDAPLMDGIGQYRAQGRIEGAVVELE